MLNKYFIQLCLVLNSFEFIKFIGGLPFDFCVPNLNKADCDLPPTPVFTYYKPGSRCEIELWRGCPTMNKFINEFECSHYCIGRLTPHFSGEVNDIGSEENMQAQCREPLNNDCSSETDGYEVYTFNMDKRRCEKVTWKGCETENKFEDKEACHDACSGFIQQSLKQSAEASEEKKTASESEKKSGSESEKKPETEEKKDEEDKKETEEKEEEKEEEGEEKKKEEGEEEATTTDAATTDAPVEKLKNKSEEAEGDPEETNSVRQRKP